MTTNRSQDAPVNNERQPIVVLLVDDQRFVGMAVGLLLGSEADIQLHCCHAAADAIATANRVSPTVILQDLVMPEIDGATLVGHFRSNPATAATPIVMLSGNNDDATRARAAAAGADDYLVKLPDKATLIACLRKHQANAQPAAARLGGSSEADDRASETLDRTVIAELRGMSGDDPDFFATLIDQFVEEGASLLQRMQAAVRGMDKAALKAAAHSLRGASTTMGANRLADLSTELEMGLARGGSVDLRQIVAIDEEFRRVRIACVNERGADRTIG